VTSYEVTAFFVVVAWAPIGVDEPIADDAENGRTGQLDSGALEPA
jgi:hypothetical protein